MTDSAYHTSVAFIGSNSAIPFEFNLLSLLLFSWYNISNKDLHCFGVALFISFLICMVWSLVKVEFKARPWQRKQNIWFGDNVFSRDSWEIHHRAGNVRCWDVLPKSEFSLNTGRAISHLGHWHITSSGKLDLWVSITPWHGIKSDSFMSESFWITWRDS